jgi:hypothetical protein
MRGAFSRILQRYGRQVTLIPREGGEENTGLAFLQPIPRGTDKERLDRPTELGLVREERFLYLGEPELSLEGMEGATLGCEGRCYEILFAQAIWVGCYLSHWRAVLTLQEEVEP